MKLPLTPIADLKSDPENKVYKIEARISRLWRFPNNGNSGNDGGVDLILVDDKGDRIQACIRGGKLIAKFQKELEEGNCCIPNHSLRFNFISFDELLSQAHDERVFVDIIGEMIGMNDLKEITAQNQPCKLLNLQLRSIGNVREEERGDLGRFEIFLDESASICCCSSLLPSPFPVPSQIKRPWRPGPRIVDFGGFGRECGPSVAIASVTQSVSVASEASVDASVGLGAGAAPGWGGAPAQGLDDLVVGLLTQLLARFPPVVPQGAPGVPPVAEVQQRAAGLFSRRLWV
ncbi:unnamed protein product [Microthlaspi erraticum]|uniref:DUF223 domain-containing protein n=1 Tax=Microthlaspi erraticum TaxID=1685480 RepID=A0A6D2HI27_9BRAS|nr:unnamed protein product [Microthlaspi erraticum]